MHLVEQMYGREVFDNECYIVLTPQDGQQLETYRFKKGQDVCFLDTNTGRMGSFYVPANSIIVLETGKGFKLYCEAESE